MEKSWYRNVFRSSRSGNPESTLIQAGKGDADAQFSLGLKYATSPEPALDYVLAAEWYRKAAEQGHSLAQFNLGVMYAAGQGLTQDDSTALMWFGKAANQGDGGAQFQMAMSQYRASIWGSPEGATESRTEAYKWFCLADTQGYSHTDSSFQCLNLSMSHDEVVEGKRRAAAFTTQT